MILEKVHYRASVVADFKFESDVGKEIKIPAPFDLRAISNLQFPLLPPLLLLVHLTLCNVFVMSKV